MGSQEYWSIDPSRVGPGVHCNCREPRSGEPNAGARGAPRENFGSKPCFPLISHVFLGKSISLEMCKKAQIEICTFGFLSIFSSPSVDIGPYPPGSFALQVHIHRGLNALHSFLHEVI